MGAIRGSHGAGACLGTVKAMREWWSKLRAVVLRDGLDKDLRAEMDAHLQMQVEANVDRGMTDERASRL